MKVIIFGASGQVGQALYGPLYGFVEDQSGILYMPSRKQLDLRDLAEIPKYIRAVNPDLIINAAAYTAVDSAEEDSDTAHLLNFSAATAIASGAAKIDAYLVHYSTDYVFDGSKGFPYTEKDHANPINVYGKTKLLGDTFILTHTLHGVILRTSWVYSLTGSNFYLTMRDIYRAGKVPMVVDDQVGCPTSAYTIADVTMKIVKKDYPGRPIRVVNLSCGGQTSWWGFTAELARLLGCKPPLSCTTDYYLTTAKRPRYTVLDGSVLSVGGIPVPHWKTSLEDVVRKDTGLR